MKAPSIVWIDERIAAGLPQDKDAELAERGINQIRYVSQKRVNDLVDAARPPGELIIQIQTVGEILYGLTNHGQLYAFGVVIGKTPGDDRAAGWNLMIESELSP